VTAALMNETALQDPGDPVPGIPPADFPHQDAASEVQLLPITEQVDPARIEPVLIFVAKGEGEPVRHIDQILVFDGPTVNLRFKPIVTSRQVGAGIMDLVGDRLRRRAASAEIAVADRAQGPAVSVRRVGKSRK
jgi:hypothetical protein